jgi:hypothetical protein
MNKSNINRFLIFFALFQGLVTAQNETSKWFFGKYTGLDFMTTPPTCLTGSMSTIEGCASIADGAGNLLFYTDAVKVWDQTHSIMANGSGLLGNGPYQTTQAALIVKKPLSQNIYYLFTLADGGGPNGLRYSTIDMSLAAGLGSVTVKNILLQTPSSEKMTAVKHCDGTSVWLISHDLNNSDFRSFLVTSAGVNTVPVVSNFPASTITYTFGSMKASPNGSKIALAALSTTAFASTGGFEIYDFDNFTGSVTSRQNLFSTHGASGCEFSPDGSKLYGTANTTQNLILYQWDLCADSMPAVVTSKYIVSNSPFPKQCIQMAQNGKLYVARNINTELGVINNPNLVGAACNYSDSGLPITTGTIQLGLPNFVTSYFFTKAASPFSYSNTATDSCRTARFAAQTCSFSTTKINSLIWDFGELSSGASNTSTVTNPFHKYSSIGTFTVKVIRNFNCYSDTVIQPVTIKDYSPLLSISGKTAFCYGETHTLAVNGADTYSWVGGSSTSTFLINSTISATYSVVGTNTTNGCSSVKTISISVAKCQGTEKVNQFSFKVYPNPLTSLLLIEIESPAEVLFRNSLGREVKRSKIQYETNVVDLEELDAGIYEANLIRDGLIIGNFKVVKLRE